MLDLQPIVNDRAAIQSNMALRHFDDHPIGPGAGLLQGRGPVEGRLYALRVLAPNFASPMVFLTQIKSIVKNWINSWPRPV
jgi:hypothetical protein